ncbi:MAG: phosphatidylserine decarboxylase, partial [Gammaproteobacteria bacterium]|nr:phosphatidylserine decarboxylase [Gammaproteobacteria bacterium]
MVSASKSPVYGRRSAPEALAGATDAESGGLLPNIHIGETQELKFLAGLPAVGEPYSPRQPATQNLKALIEEKNYQGNFESAIRFVAEQRVPELSQIKTLEQFYFYVDTLATWVPEIRHWTSDGKTMHERTVYLRIVQFYYYFNLRELDYLQSPIDPVEGKTLTPLSSWLHSFALEWGSFLDTPESANLLQSFKSAPEYNYQDYQKNPEDYLTFNEFFARQFRDIETMRPVAQSDNDRIITFPAESTYVGQWTVSTEKPPSIVVKHIEWSIQELLNDSDYSADFTGGRFCHSFLNTYDYHRLHTPVAGKVI